jgi:Cys-tRNA(Pro)/Cys-tRNA(Cys) deacylase
MSSKTLAMKVLESQKIAYKVHTYPEHERDAKKIALWIEMPAERIFKTLVVTRDQGKSLLVMIPASHQLNLKMLAKELGEKKVKFASHVQAEQMTGLQVGGISPLVLLNRGFTILLDRSAFAFDTICVSAGKKGLNIELGPVDLCEVTAARYVDVIS